VILGAQNFNRPKTLANYEPIPLALVLALRVKRKELKLTISGMAAQLGMTHGKVDKILSTVIRSASPTTLKKLEAFVAQNTDLSTTS